MSKVQKPSNSECYTSSSEPFINNLKLLSFTQAFRSVDKGMAKKISVKTSLFNIISHAKTIFLHIHTLADDGSTQKR
jgi:hypothetical protein